MKPNDDTDALPDWVCWLACDADGTWWGYEAEPHRHEHGWYENEVGRHIRISHGTPSQHWARSLQKRP